VDTEPTPDEAAALVDLLHVLLANATDQEKRIIEMRLAGHEVAEVAAAADCSERTVQRKLGVLRQRLERLLGQVAAP
jgi:DNA-directed RNA polymerase specialized sigma24 family protein